MADKSINDLPLVAELLDSGLTVVYQGGVTNKIAGSSLKTFAQNAVVGTATSAAAAATALALGYKDDAELAAGNAANDASDAAAAKTAAVNAKNAAVAAQTAIENMTVSNSTLSPGSSATVVKTTQSGVVNLAFGIPAGTPGEAGTITSIARTSGTGAPGTTDTYTITTNDGNTFAFTVYNGANGQGAPTSTTPAMDGAANVGTETTFARGDHVHPTDTTRAPLASPTFTGTPAAPTASSGTNTTQIATTAFVQSAVPALHQYSATLSSSGWSASGGYQVQTVSVTGIKASYTIAPMIDISFAGNDATADQALIDAFALVAFINTAAGSITAYCAGNAPTVNIPILINTVG